MKASTPEKKRLYSESFLFESNICKFVNENKINRKDIQQICGTDKEEENENI